MRSKKENKEEKKKISDEPMTIAGHLREMRNRIAVCIVVFAIGFGLGLYFSPQISEALTAMGTKYGYKFVFIAPQELIMVYFQLAMITGVVAAAPFIAYEAYAYAVPAMSENGRKSVAGALLFGFGMFVLGILFAYKISVPFMLYFLISLQQGVSIQASISIQEFVSFIMTVFIIFGVIFEMPVIVALMTSVGIMKPEWMKKARKAAIVVIFLVAAIITPPDVVSQIMVAVPMCALYELSTWLSRVIWQKKESKASAEEA